MRRGFIRAWCKDCKKSFSRVTEAQRRKNKRNDGLAKHKLHQILLDHLEGKSYRALAANVRQNPIMLCRDINHVLANLKTAGEVTRELNPLKYAGNFIVDGKFIPAKAYAVVRPSFVPRSRKRQKINRGLVHISGCDYETHDIPLSLMGRTEEYWAYDIYFRQLKELKYPLRSLTCDDKSSIRQACLIYYPKAQIQLCIRHYSEEIARKLKIRSIERTLTSLENKLDRMRDDFFYTTRPVAQHKAVRIVNQISDLEHRYWIAKEFSEILKSLLTTKSVKAYNKYLDELKIFFAESFPLERGAFRKRIINIYKKFLKDQQFLFTSLKHPKLNIPRTTNLQEGYHSHWELRLSSIRGFESEKTAKNYLNALVLKRRFSILTSCRKKFKQLNGKSPLEHSGGIDTTLKDWVKFCRR